VDHCFVIRCNISYCFIELVAKAGLTLGMHYIIEYLQDECSFVSLHDVERVLEVGSIDRFLCIIFFYRMSVVLSVYVM
jgi:hypothetical protein